MARSANHKQWLCWWCNRSSSSKMVLITGLTPGERPLALLGPALTALSLVGPSGGRGRELCTISVDNFTPGRCAKGGTGGIPGVQGSFSFFFWQLFFCDVCDAEFSLGLPLGRPRQLLTANHFLWHQAICGGFSLDLPLRRSRQLLSTNRFLWHQANGFHFYDGRIPL